MSAAPRRFRVPLEGNAASAARPERGARKRPPARRRLERGGLFLAPPRVARPAGVFPSGALQKAERRALGVAALTRELKVETLTRTEGNPSGAAQDGNIKESKVGIMAKNPVEVWVWLLLVMQPFNNKTNYILAECNGDAAQAGRNIRDGKYDYLSDAEKKNAESVRMKDVRELIETCAKNNVRIITLDDSEYPPLLRGIENPPIVLFCAGNLSGLDNVITLSAVGARNVSDYGINVTHRIIEPLARLGMVIVSGMAVGTDAEVHRACLAQHGRTIGVLGCGILVNYPMENAQLKRDIIANGGAIISELLPYSRTFGAYFDIRNRIISGLSLGTLVIEAGDRSGALLTARHAVKQGREVFCVPPRDLFSTRYNGVVPLLREEAAPVYNFTDILNEFSMYFSNEKYIKDYISAVEKEQHERKKPKKPRQKVAAVIPEEPKPEQPEPDRHTELTEEQLASFAPEEAEILKILAASSAKIDDLIDKTEHDYNELSEILTDLEIAGAVVREQDGVYRIV